jgi:hypothetical protein
MLRILVATRNGMHTLDQRGHEAAAHHTGRPVTAVVRDGPQLWAIVEGAQVWHAPDEGEWRHVATLEGVAATSIAMTDAIHVGSSKARLFRLTDGALEPVEAFDAVEGRESWYTPWGGPPDTRSISEWGADVYVSVHVGGVLHTGDSGGTWNPTIDIDADVHQVATAGGLVLAAGARGLSTSTDKGATWSLRTDGLDARYSRAVVVCGDQVLLSASEGPRGGRAGVYRADLQVSESAPERFLVAVTNEHDQRTGSSTTEGVNKGSRGLLMQHELAREEGRVLYAKRAGMVEPVFGQIKEVRGARRFSRRGLRACDAEWS